MGEILNLIESVSEGFPFYFCPIFDVVSFVRLSAYLMPFLLLLLFLLVLHTYIDSFIFHIMFIASYSTFRRTKAFIKNVFFSFNPTFLSYR